MLTSVADDSSPPDRPLFISVAQAAHLLGVGESAIRAAVARGDIQAIRIGKLIRIKRAELLRQFDLPEDYEV
jgi:excisionase family DNA binding protein